MTEHYIELSLSDICHAVRLQEPAFVELVEHGIIKPIGKNRTEWCFDLTMVSIAKRALRLHRDLELEWEAVALIVELIEERDRLRSENEQLAQRLHRFLQY